MNGLFAEPGRLQGIITVTDGQARLDAVRELLPKLGAECRSPVSWLIGPCDPSSTLRPHSPHEGGSPASVDGDHEGCRA